MRKINALAALARAAAHDPRSVQFLYGLLAGTHLLLWLSWFATSWGSSPAVFGGAGLAIALALCMPGDRSRAEPSRKTSPGFPIALIHLSIALYTLALPGLLDLSLEALRMVSSAAVDGPALTLAWSLSVSVLLLAPGILLLKTAVGSHDATAASAAVSADITPPTWVGLSAALFVLPITAAVHSDLRWITGAAAGGSLSLAAFAWRRERRDTIAAANESAPPDAAACPLVDRHAALHGTASSGQARSSVMQTLRESLSGSADVGLGVLAGLSLAAAVHAAQQLVAGVAYVACASLAGICAGVAVGVVLQRRFWTSSRTWQRSRVAATLVMGCGLAAIVVLDPWLKPAALHVTAEVSQTWAIFLLRGGLMFCWTVPFGTAIGLRMSASRPAGGRRFITPSRFLAVVLAGFTVGRLLTVTIAPVLIAVIVTAVAVLAVDTWRSGLRIRRRAVTAAAACLLLGVSLWRLPHYDPAGSARTQFSTATLLAYRDGTPPEQLSQIDDGRLIAAFDRDGSTWSVWKHAGNQMLLRENGVLHSVASLNPAVCPEASTEMLPALLPLVMHPAPRRVALVGIGGGTPLRTCLAFPVAQVTCVEPHAGLLRAVNASVDHDAFSLGDPRLTVIQAEPVLAAAANIGPQDVIILNHREPVVWSDGAEVSTAYYRRVAARLAPDGLLCQRFHYGDFGDEPIRAMAATLRTVFPQVIAVETGPGELAFIAGRSSDWRPADDLLARASAPQVRSLLDRLGWDWSVLLALSAFDAEAVAAFADAESSPPNTFQRGRFAFQLPVEVARWGAKTDEVRALLAPHGSRMLAWLSDPADVQDVVHRVNDVAERQRIIAEHPDTFWAYRVLLRERLQQRPRTTIRQVAHEGLVRSLHPEDERRKGYLEALGAAATQTDPDAASIARLARFLEPHDPLTSFFVHHELAHLHARRSERDRAAELTHRLHTVFFAPPNDRSVRNVSAAIEIILDEPHVLPDAAERWDALNALLEVLMRRWRLRAASSAATSYAAADAGDSFDAAVRALKAMDELARSVPLDDSVWRHRRALLERHLIRPLRRRRSSVTHGTRAARAELTGTRSPTTLRAAPAPR